MTVNEQSVRNLLDNPAASSVPGDTIAANITRSISIVNAVKDASATTVRVDHAVRATAVWLTYGSYMEGITQQLGNISVADETKLEHLRKVAELFINTISATSIDLDPDADAMNMLVGISPEAFVLTTTEAHPQGD